jgi:hypothetical protein
VRQPPPDMPGPVVKTLPKAITRRETVPERGVVGILTAPFCAKGLIGWMTRPFVAPAEEEERRRDSEGDND